MPDKLIDVGGLRLPLALLCSSLALATPARAHQGVHPALLKHIQPSPQAASRSQEDLIEEGERLFFEETFKGNGRTCGTCHRDENNYTIDPKFIATLPPDDPLFVAERVPALSELENPRLLRRFGLITENLDGFDQPGVLRGVPHVQGLTQSLEPDKDAVDGGPFPLVEATGWSGDGAPGRGTLQDFAVGAVVQHFPKTLGRQEGTDFRLPTEAELKALLAFQLSVGRQAELRVNPRDPKAVVFSDRRVERGKALFHGTKARDGSTRACSTCHVNGGANTEKGGGGMFATGVENLPNAPACLTDGRAPGDGGLGAGPVQTVRPDTICGPSAKFTVTFRGNRLFNPPSLLEAADTAPFFHNNAAATVEDAVAFYASDTFNASPAGNGQAFVLGTAAVDDIAAFLRALSLLDNAREADRLIEAAKRAPASEAGDVILEARENALDAVEVLADSRVPLFVTSRPGRLFAAAARKLRDAATNGNLALLELAKQDLARARGLVAGNAPAS